MQRARERALARRDAYRSRGSWSAAPIDLVADAVTEFADRVALVDRRTTLTYAELDHAVGQAATALHTWGVEPGDSVLLVVGNTADAVVAIHATWRAGAVALLAGTSSGSTFVADVLAQASTRVALAPGEWIASTGDAVAPGGWRPIEALLGDEALPTFPPRDADAPATVFFTSGTTSRPKGVIHSRNTLAVAARNYAAAAHNTADEAFFIISPLASVTGVLQAALVPPRIGARAVLEERWDADATFDFLVDSGGSFYGGPDTILGRLLDVAEQRGHRSLPLTGCYVGGTMLDRRILDRAEREFGVSVLRAYGSSEAPISTAGLRHEDQATRLADDGVALDDVEVAVGTTLDPAECRIRGPHLFLGYVDSTDDADAFTADDWFCTGDIAELVDGRLRIYGRIKDIVIRNGMKIPLAEVEGLAGTLPGVIQCAAYGVPDDATGEHLALAIHADAGRSITLRDVVGHLTASGLPAWKLPEELVLWDVPLPETATGKVVRAALVDGAANRPQMAVERLSTNG
jgi:acyl-CoA synthetase (AMP-forming)/AMP-acid ligase II